MPEINDAKRQGKGKQGKKKRPERKTRWYHFMADLQVKDLIKVSVKAATMLAALTAVVILMVVGADISPSGILQGFSDKYLFITASGSGYPVDVAGTNTVKAAHITRGTAVMTDTSFIIYDRSGRTVLSEPHYLTSPCMENSRKYSLLYGRRGKDFTLRTLSGTACSGKTKNAIICADICAAGRFAFVTKSETTDAEIVVYAPDGTLLQKWKSVEEKISDVTLSPSGKYIAWVSLSTDEGVLVSKVNMRKIGEKKNLKEYAFKDTLIVDIRFEDNSCVAAVGDNFASFMGVHNDDSFLYPYNDSNLNSYCFNDSGELALVFSANSDGHDAFVTVIDRKCRKISEIQTGLTAPIVDLGDGRINLLCNSAVSCYSYEGKLLRQADVPTDCQMILTSEGRLLAKGTMTLSAVD